MNIEEFISKFAEAIEVYDDSQLNADTEFHELEEWSSLSSLLVIAFFDKEFDIQLGNKEIKECITLQDLYNLATA